MHSTRHLTDYEGLVTSVGDISRLCSHKMLFAAIFSMHMISLNINQSFAENLMDVDRFGNNLLRYGNVAFN